MYSQIDHRFEWRKREREKVDDRKSLECKSIKRIVVLEEDSGSRILDILDIPDILEIEEPGSI